MKTLILYSRSSTFRPRSVLASLATDQKKEGHDVTVVDISAYSYVNQDLPPRWFARLFGADVYPQALEQILESGQIPFISLPVLRVQEELPAEITTEFEESVFSELVTYLRSDQPSDTWFTHYTKKKIQETAKPIYAALTEFLEHEHFDRVIVPNGRVGHLRLALLACKKVGVGIEYFEIGRALEHSYYLGTQQIHDREGTQAEVATVTAHLVPDQVQEIATAWLNTRMTTGLAIHPYNKGWSNNHGPFNDRPVVPLAVFFSSSVDEFTSYGGSWQTHEWADQYEAFGAIIDLLSQRGVRCVLRIHPNLQNKSRQFVTRELGRVQELMRAHPHLEVLSHTNPTSSYELLQKADYVVVGRSTLGLEGSCLGKCVWTTTAARYDAIADIRQALRPAEVTDENFHIWTVDPQGGQRFVSYWVEQDTVFSVGEENWATWDALKSPTPMKIGNLFVHNTVWHKIHLVRLEIVKAINRKRGKTIVTGPNFSRQGNQHGARQPRQR